MDLIRRDKALMCATGCFPVDSERADECKTIAKRLSDCPSAFEGMTNGEVMQALFPNMKVHEYTEKVVLNGLGDEFQIQSMAWKNWWDSPYKGVSE